MATNKELFRQMREEAERGKVQAGGGRDDSPPSGPSGRPLRGFDPMAEGLLSRARAKIKSGLRRALVITAAVAVTGGAGIIGANYIRNRQREQRMEGRTAELAKRLESNYHSCVDKEHLMRECVDGKTRRALAAQAKMAKEAKEYRKAGLAYVALGNIPEAVAMAAECRKAKDEDGALEIDAGLKAKTEALKRALPGFEAKLEKEREESIAAAAKRLGVMMDECIDGEHLLMQCMNQKTRRSVATAAKMAEDAKDYARAGRHYGELGNIDKAKAMAAECRKADDIEGATVIEEALKIRAAVVAKVLPAVEKNAEKRKEVIVKAMVKYLKGLQNCRDLSHMQSECLADDAANALATNAHSFELTGDFRKAGLNYAKLGRTDDAKRMMTQCENADDREGAKEIEAALKAKAEAINRVLGQ